MTGYLFSGGWTGGGPDLGAMGAGGGTLAARLVEHLGQFVEDGIARQAQLAQDFSHGAHNLGQAFGADDNQRDREDQNYFKKVQTSMTVPRTGQRNSMTLRGCGKIPRNLACSMPVNHHTRPGCQRCLKPGSSRIAAT